MSRKWIKLHCYERLHGSSVYMLSEAEQSVWDKLLCLAGLCDRGGLIADNDNKPFPHAHIAHEIHTTTDLFEQALAKFIDQARVKENRHGLIIVNWDKYQSEYDRQKPYRAAKKAGVPWEERIANVAQRSAGDIAEVTPILRKRVLELLDRENPQKAAKVRALIGEGAKDE